ncbi:MAG: molybdenum cofactor guanylyltransferase MobA [Stenotrophobium sp.]
MTRTSPVPPAPQLLTAAILAGGQGARMGGADKGLIEIAGKPLIERVFERLRPQVAEILICTNRNHEIYARYGHPLLRDRGAEYAGPMAGMAVALTAARTTQVLFVPVDAPYLPVDLASRLCMAAENHDTDLCVAHDGRHMIPVCCLVSVRLAADLEASLARGERSVQTWLHRHQALEVSFAEWPREFWSVNTPQELITAEKLLKTRDSLA